jgi:hypothetical protein
MRRAGAALCRDSHQREEAHTMKTRIERMSPHQNGKVFAIMMAVSSLVFLVPFVLLAGAAAPKGMGLPMFMILLLPLMYLVLGYLMVALGCWIYNILVRFTGGIEFESRSVEP